MQPSPSSSRTHRLVQACLVPFLLAAMVAPTVAQEARTLHGQVFDASGAVLPGVTVTLDEGAAARTATTAPDGAYVFESVGAGAHVLDIKVPGFQAFHDTVTLQAPGDWVADVTMALGTVQESIVVTTPRTPRAQAGTATAGTAGPTRVRVGGNVKPPRKLKDVKPVYPAAMREAGRGAVVRVEAAIGADGTVVHLRPLGGFVHPAFVAAAGEAVSQWEFSPTLLNGAPVMVEMTITVAFRVE